MNQITELLISDIGIGNHEAIVRAMNLDKAEFLKWGRRCSHKILDTIHALDIEISIEDYQSEFYNYITEQTEEIKTQFSYQLCKNIQD